MMQMDLCGKIASVNLHSAVLLLLLFVSVYFISNVAAKRVDGSVRTNDDWHFITRFCFLTNKGSMNYEIEYPVGYGTQEILLYYDTPGQWDSIYKRGKTCDEKRSVLSVKSNQIIALNTSVTDTSKYAGCTLVNYQGDTWYNCKGERSFQSTRERWWYIALGRCLPPKDQVQGLYLNYYIHMTNGDDLLHKEYSADEFYILPVDIVFFVIYIMLLSLSIYYAVKLRKRQLFHTTYKLYMCALAIWTLHLLLLVIAWGYYGKSGWELDGLEVTGRVLRAASTIVFILMLILIAKGYTITRGRLSTCSAMKITVFMMVYIMVIAALFIWEGVLFDPGVVLYYYESPAGYGMITMHLIAWLWFLYSIMFTLKHCSTKFRFYVPFFTFFTLWFWAGPVVILTGMFAMAKWSREKTVNGVELFVHFLGHIFFLALTRPSAANLNFPYTIRTSQIASMTLTDEDEVITDGNPYVISNQGMTPRVRGPNLELFITSKTEDTLDVDPISHPVQAGNVPSPQPQGLPPSYPQVMGLTEAMFHPTPQFVAPTKKPVDLPPVPEHPPPSDISPTADTPTRGPPLHRRNVLPPLKATGAARLGPSAPPMSDL